jgi:septum formation protein
MGVPSFVLASASPARRRLLQSAGIEAIVHPSHFDESQIDLEEPKLLVQALAKRKAETVAAQLESVLILGCDSILSVDGEIYGKPADSAEAIARWHKMSGRVGDLYTGHALIDLTLGNAESTRTLVDCQITRVYFAKVSDREIDAYVATGEPLNCAGCFALEGRGGLFVEKLEGCHTNVIGLSLPLLRQMLSQLGYNITDFWQSSPFHPSFDRA